jgi:PII-like signaling protein
MQLYVAEEKKYHDQQMQRWIVHDMVRVAVNC